MAQALVALVAGLLFGAGLVIADLTNPARVTGFLDLAGDWDPTLLTVVGGAVVVASLGNVLARRRGRPLLAERFAVPMSELIDWRLVGGAALFGVGWGLAGYCPAPALTGAVLFNPKTWLFVLAMFAGMMIFRWQQLRATHRSGTPSA